MPLLPPVISAVLFANRMTVPSRMNPACGTASSGG
jgi:hypothetical protein